MTTPAIKVRVSQHALEQFEARHNKKFRSVPSPEAYLAALALDPSKRITPPTFRQIDGALRQEFRVSDGSGLTFPVAANVVDGAISDVWTVPTVFRRP